MVESHAVIFRQHILQRYQKTQLREIYEAPQTYGLKPTYVKFETKCSDANELKSKLLELPKGILLFSLHAIFLIYYIFLILFAEWYTIQVTAQYESPSILRQKKCTSEVMHAIHITVLPTGSSDTEPLCITLPRPAIQVSYDICKEIQKLLHNNKSLLTSTYANHEHYWKMRMSQDDQMKVKLKLIYFSRRTFKMINYRQL